LKDERVQIEEWVQVLKIGADDPKAEPKWFLDYMTFMFKLMDVSGTFSRAIWLSLK